MSTPHLTRRISSGWFPTGPPDKVTRDPVCRSVVGPRPGLRRRSGAEAGSCKGHELGTGDSLTHLFCVPTTPRRPRARDFYVDVKSKVKRLLITRLLVRDPPSF